MPAPRDPAVPPGRSRADAEAGGSAQREYERRSQRREERLRAQHPRLGGLLLALTNAPASTQVWAQGARGERVVGASLDALAEEGILALHDRKLPRTDGRNTRANIDHIAVAASGVWVVDAKTHKGALEVRRRGGLIGPRTESLFIAGRDRTSLIDSLNRQVEAVRAVLSAVDADVPVRGALCFVGTDLPWTTQSIGGMPLVGPRGLAKQLRAGGPLDAEERMAVVAYLSQQMSPA